MRRAQLLARVSRRHARWNRVVALNTDIRHRVRGREPVAQIAKEYGLAPDKVERIAGLFGV